MPVFEDAFSVLKNDRKLTKEELIRAIRFSIAAEYEAIQLYRQLAESIDDELSIEVLNHIADEELVHVGEFLKVLEMINPEEKEFYIEGGKEVENMKFATKSDAIQYLSDFTGKRIKIADDSWINKFMNILREKFRLYDDMFIYTVNVKGYLKWYHEPEHKERAFGDYGPMVTVDKAEASVDEININRITFKQTEGPNYGVEIEEILEELEEEGFSIKDRLSEQEIERKIQQEIKDGVKEKILIEGSDKSSFDSLASFHKEIDAQVKLEIESGKIIPSRPIIDMNKLEEDLKDHIVENEEPS